MTGEPPPQKFPDRTAAPLYLDVKLHKYVLGGRVGNDVGLSATFERYSARLKKGGMRGRSYCILPTLSQSVVAVMSL